MRRAAESSQTPQNPIWQLKISTPQWSLMACRTQQLGRLSVDSFQIDEGVLAIATQFLLNYNKPASITDRFAPTRIAPRVWIVILNIAVGFGSNPSLQILRQVAAAHLISRNKLNLLRPASSSLFPVIPVHINQLIEAILHGDEKMVRGIINAAPELLLKKGTAIDLQGRPFTGTPLQAAIAADDIAPNTNSTGTVEIILEKLKQFDPEHYHAIFKKQACELYKESLRFYISMQKVEISRLYQLAGPVSAEDPGAEKQIEAIEKAQTNLRAYTEALRSGDLNRLFETHKKAQADNAFDFKPYVDAIRDIDLSDLHQKAQLDDVMALINAKEEETKAVIARTGVLPRESDDCRNKPFHSLTLVQKLNRFREKLAEHLQREIIFNPQHILAGLRANEVIWQILPDTEDPDFHKRSVIFSQLCGFAQRLASEPVKQDIRQGAWYLTKENEPRTRQSRFNTFDNNYNVVKDDVVDASVFLAVGGLGYKFAGGRAVAARRLGPLSVVWRYLVKTYVQQKQSMLSELITPQAQSTHSRIGRRP